MMRVAKQETIKNVDGQTIFFRSWHPTDPTRGTVVVIPGFNAHSAYYPWVAEHLTSMGLAVYAIDLRGRGQSEGERFFVESFDDYVLDVDAVMTVVKTREGVKPLIMLGHSAGGVVACLYALDHPLELNGLISESFAHELPAPDFVLSVFKGMGNIAPHVHLLHLKNEKFSRDPQVVAAMNLDSLIENETQPTQTMAALVRADERLKRDFVLIKTPVLILHGTADENTRPSGSQHFFDQVGSSDKTLRLYEGGYHDLLNDVDKETVMAEIEGWIEAHL
jgi:acylglycerol lipase